MAQKVQVLFVDDVDGSEADETVSFALDGVLYEIDVSLTHAQALREAVAPWLGHARRTGGRSSRTAAKGRPVVQKVDLTALREWARENGFEVSDRGRISGEVHAAWERRNDVVAPAPEPEVVPAEPKPKKRGRKAVVATFSG